MNKSGIKSPCKFLLHQEGIPGFRTSKQASKRLGLGLGISKVASDTDDNDMKSLEPQPQSSKVIKNQRFAEKDKDLETNRSKPRGVQGFPNATLQNQNNLLNQRTK